VLPNLLVVSHTAPPVRRRYAGPAGPSTVTHGLGRAAPGVWGSARGGRRGLETPSAQVLSYFRAAYSPLRLGVPHTGRTYLSRSGRARGDAARRDRAGQGRGERRAWPRTVRARRQESVAPKSKVNFEQSSARQSRSHSRLRSERAGPGRDVRRIRPIIAAATRRHLCTGFNPAPATQSHAPTAYP